MMLGEVTGVLIYFSRQHHTAPAACKIRECIVFASLGHLFGRVAAEGQKIPVTSCISFDNSESWV